MTVRGEVELEVDLCGTILVGHFMIAEIADDVVLGIGLQRARAGIMVNHHTQQVEFEGGKTVPYISQRISGLSKCCKVLADQNSGDTPPKGNPDHGVYLRPHERIGESEEDQDWGNLVRRGRWDRGAVMVGKALVDVGKDYIPIRLLNTTSEPITIYKGTPAGVVTPGGRRGHPSPWKPRKNQSRKDVQKRCPTSCGHCVRMEVKTCRRKGRRNWRSC